MSAEDHKHERPGFRTLHAEEIYRHVTENISANENLPRTLLEAHLPTLTKGEASFKAKLYEWLQQDGVAKKRYEDMQKTGIHPSDVRTMQSFILYYIREYDSAETSIRALIEWIETRDRAKEEYDVVRICAAAEEALRAMIEYGEVGSEGP